MDRILEALRNRAPLFSGPLMKAINLDHIRKSACRFYPPTHGDRRCPDIFFCSFGHKNLPDLNRDELVSEMKQLDDALFGIIGRRPTYMRAPFFAYSDLVLQTMKELQYHVIDASVDTKDFENNTPEGVPTSVQLFKQELDEGGTIALAHDVHQTTVQLLAQQMLDEVKRRGLRRMYSPIVRNVFHFVYHRKANVIFWQRLLWVNV